MGSGTKLSVSFQIPEPVATEVLQHCEIFRAHLEALMY